MKHVAALLCASAFSTEKWTRAGLEGSQKSFSLWLWREEQQQGYEDINQLKSFKRWKFKEEDEEEELTLLWASSVCKGRRSNPVLTVFISPSSAMMVPLRIASQATNTNEDWKEGGGRTKQKERISNNNHFSGPFNYQKQNIAKQNNSSCQVCINVSSCGTNWQTVKNCLIDSSKMQSFLNSIPFSSKAVINLRYKQVMDTEGI